MLGLRVSFTHEILTMKHAVLVLGLPGLVAAQQACNNQNLNPACPGLGDTCGSANPLCSAGSYCSVSSFGGGFYTGKCVAAGAPSIFNVRVGRLHLDFGARFV